jgi:hypothetical protein
MTGRFPHVRTCQVGAHDATRQSWRAWQCLFVAPMSFPFTDSALRDWIPILRLFLSPTLSAVEPHSSRRKSSIRVYAPATLTDTTLFASRCERGTGSRQR